MEKTIASPASFLCENIPRQLPASSGIACIAEGSIGIEMNDRTNSTANKFVNLFKKSFTFKEQTKKTSVKSEIKYNVARTKVKPGSTDQRVDDSKNIAKRKYGQ